jgi:hypothetical protein
VLAFWDRWLEGRPAEQAALANRTRARWHLRRARALILSGRTQQARVEVKRATTLGRASALDPSELPALRQLWVATHLPNRLVRGAVALKRLASTVSAGRPAASIEPPNAMTHA